MKELTIEEKAERYDEIIIEFKPIYDLAKEQGRIIDVEEFERIFPELKESEDERVRKALIEYFNEQCDMSDWNGVYGYQVVAWLEKQGEKELNDDEDTDILQRFAFYLYKDEPNVLYLSNVFVNEEYRNRGIGTKILEVTDEVAKSLNCHTIRLKTKKDSNAERLYRTHGYNSLTTEDSDEIWLEKQGEKSTDEEMKEALRTEYEKGRADAIAEMQKPAWSEEDETKIKSIIAFLKSPSLCAMDGNKGIIDESIKYLNSLKDKVQPQPKQEWSKEDEAMWAEIADLLWEGYKQSGSKFSWNNIRNWVNPKLKSLSSQNTWKPSYNQMNKLCWIANQNKDNMIGKELMTLYNDLKKLKRE